MKIRPTLQRGQGLVQYACLPILTLTLVILVVIVIAVITITSGGGGA